MMRRLAAATTAIGLLVAVSACGSATTATPGDRPSQAGPGPSDLFRFDGLQGLFAAQADAEPPARATPEEATTRVSAMEGTIPVAAAGVDQLALAPEPARLQLDRVGIDMTVVDVGIKDDGEMELPDTAELAGWFRLGGNPGGGLRQGRNAVIAAHVDDAVIGRGPFARLRDSRPGDPVQVSLDDGTTVRYVVDRVEQTAKTEVDFEVVFGSEDGALVLVTCGRWDADVKHYEDNVLVWALPEDGV